MFNMIQIKVINAQIMVSDSVVQLTELFVEGIAQGAVLALLGLGITVVFGLGGVLNLAIGAFAVLGVLVAVELTGIIGNTAIAAILSIAIVGLVGLIIDRSLLSSVYKSEGEERTLLGIFVTLGLAILLDGLLTVYYPSSYVLSSGISSVSILGIHIRGSSIVIITVAIVVFLLLYYLFRNTYLGLAARTVMQDESGAILCGIDPRNMRTIVFVGGTAIAGLAGILYSVSSSVQVATAFELTIQALIVSIVGGITSILGAVMAGLALGVVVTYVSAYIGTYIAEVTLFAVAIIMLLVQKEEII